MREGELFDQMAEYYDRYRPGYPEEAVEYILRRGDLTAGSRVLEVGAGSGKATRQFLGKGLSLTCLDPGAELVAAGNARWGQQGARFVVGRFEDFGGETESYDAILSAQAFHWISQPDGYRQCMRLLRPGGTLALMWNLDLFSDSEDDRALWELLSRYSGFVTCMQRADYPARKARIRGEMAELFTAPEVVHFTQEIRYTPEDYYRYLMTSQVFFQQEEAVRNDCMRALCALVEQRPEALCRRYTCEVYLARKGLY